MVMGLETSRVENDTRRATMAKSTSPCSATYGTLWGAFEMRTLAEFTKTTLIGGVLIILPIYISILLLAKAISGILNLVSPITASLPASVEFRQVLAILALAAICFIAGLIARTGPGFRAKNAFEAAVLSKLPGYTLLRGLTGRVTGQIDEPTFAPALVEIEEALVPALIIEELEDGSYTVLVPSVPTPMAGALYILPKERVHPVDVSFTDALKVFTKWGAGAGEFVKAMKPTSLSQRGSAPTGDQTQALLQP
jgi:uncharacterized membrane protein